MALMVVIGMLAMFLLIAVTFVLSASSHRESAVASSFQEQSGDSSDSLMNNALGQVLRGSNHPMSAIGPHSLLEDMYGARETRAGIVLSAGWTYPQTNTSTGQFAVLELGSFGPDNQPGLANVDDSGTLGGSGGNGLVDDITEFNAQGSDDSIFGQTRQNPFQPGLPPERNPIIDDVEGYYAGRVLTFLDGPAKNESVRIVRYFDLNPDNKQMRFLVTRPESGRLTQVDLNKALLGARVLINGRPFNGAGFGFRQSHPNDTPNDPPPVRPGILDLNYSILAKQAGGSGSSEAWAKMPFGLTPNPVERSYRDFLNPFVNAHGVDADEDYDAADFQNMMLAGLIWSPEPPHGGAPRWRVRIPSLHRPDLVAYHMAQIDSSNSNKGFDPSVNWVEALTTNGAGRLRQKIILRPDPQDHVSFPNVVWKPGMDDWSGNPFFHPVLGPWDVDNDNDGLTDSIWVDLGAPVQTNEAGKKYKPLFAILCIDLDGRFNLNVHGNWTHYSGQNQSTGSDVQSANGLEFSGGWNNGFFQVPFGGFGKQTSPGAYLLGGRKSILEYEFGRGNPTLVGGGAPPVTPGLARVQPFAWGSKNGNDYQDGPYPGPTLNLLSGASGSNVHVTTGQGFSVAEVNLGGVLPLPILRPTSSGSSRGSCLDPYRMLLEGIQNSDEVNKVANSIISFAEGRYGEKGVNYLRRVGAYGGFNRFAEMGSFFSQGTSSPGYARPGITFVDDNSTVPSIGIAAPRQQQPYFVGSILNDVQAFYEPVQAQTNGVYLPELASRGNRWTEASLTFTSPSNGNLQGVGNYGFWPDPTGSMMMALDFRGVPYPGYRGAQSTKGEKSPEERSPFFINYFQGQRWFQVPSAVDDPWELNPFLPGKENMAFNINEATGQLMASHPFDRYRPNPPGVAGYQNGLPPLISNVQYPYPLAYPLTNAPTQPAPPGTQNMATFSVDRIFTLGELEPLLRQKDRDYAMLPMRLRAMIGDQPGYDGGDHIGRFLLTTDSWDIPSPAITATPEIAQALSPLPTTNMSFAELLRGKLKAANTSISPSEIQRMIRGAFAQRLSNSLDEHWRFRMFPDDLLMGLRLNINRPFGNGIDDDKDGTVDESPSPGPLRERRAPRRTPPDSVDIEFPMVTAFQPAESDPLYVDAGNTNRPKPKNASDPAPVLNSLNDPSDNTAYANNGVPVPKLASNGLYSTESGAIEMSRQELAKHLYVLIMLFNDLSYQFQGDPQENFDPDQRKKLAAFRCAQWAVNAVDFRDRDAIMTPFEFDLFPFTDEGGDPSPWDVDGKLDLDDEAAAPHRGLVWGMEAPDLLITETLAFHDKRVADTDQEGGGGLGVDTDPVSGMLRDEQGKLTDMGKKHDPHFDQVRIPQGSLLVELYCAAQRAATHTPDHPDLGMFPPELYEIQSPNPFRAEGTAVGTPNTADEPYKTSNRYGLLDLSRLAPPTDNVTVEGSTRSYRFPVWRLAVSQWHPQGSTGQRMASVREQLYDPSSPFYKPYRASLGPVYTAQKSWNVDNGLIDHVSMDMFAPGTASGSTSGGSGDNIELERFVWFVDVNSLDAQPPMNVFCYRGFPRPTFNPAQPQRHLRFLVEPGHYALVGPERLDKTYDSADKLEPSWFVTTTAFTAFKGATSPANWNPTWFFISPNPYLFNPTGQPVPPVNHMRLNTGGEPLFYHYPKIAQTNELDTQSWELDHALPSGAEVMRPVCIPTARFYSKGLGTEYPYAGLNISEPLSGYREARQRPTVDVTQEVILPGGSTQDITVKDGFSPTAISDGFYPDYPYDSTQQAHDGELGVRDMVLPGTYADVRTVFLQRLANPLVAWDPVFNPYITVDWMPVDLTVYNGQTVWRDSGFATSATAATMQKAERQVQMGDNFGPAPLPPMPSTPGALTKYYLAAPPTAMQDFSTTPNYPYHFQSRQRGPDPTLDTTEVGNNWQWQRQLPLWPAMSGLPRQEFHHVGGLGGADSLGVFAHDCKSTLGYLNFAHKTSSTTGIYMSNMRPKYVNPDSSDTNSNNLNNFILNTQYFMPTFIAADYIGAPPEPFPWVFWPNRPFANQMELTLVPASSPSRFTTEYTYSFAKTERDTQVSTPPPRQSYYSHLNGYKQPPFFGKQDTIGGLQTPQDYSLSSGKQQTYQPMATLNPPQETAPFGHLLPFFASNLAVNNSSADGLKPDFYRVLEYLHVPTRFSGADEFVMPFHVTDGPSDTQRLGPAASLFAPPYNYLSKFREPGRVNLNTFVGGGGFFSTRPNAADGTQRINSAQHWGALVNFSPEHLDHWRKWNECRFAGLPWVSNTSGVPTPPNPPPVQPRLHISNIADWGGMMLFNSAKPAVFAQPFRSFTNNMEVPIDGMRLRKDDPNLTRRLIDSTLFRAYEPMNINGMANPDVAEEGLFVTGTKTVIDSNDANPSPHLSHDSNRNPYFRYQDYIKLGSVTTPRSNVYAVWVTMGMFEVEQVQTVNSNSANYRDPDTVNVTNPDGYRLVRELGADTGDIRRTRMFTIIDRTIPVAFQRGENHNVDRAVRVRRILD